MPEIRHLLGIQDSTGEEVYNALTSCQPMKSWLTPTIQGHPQLNSIFQPAFGAETVSLKVTKLQSGTWVQWQCTQGEFEWVNTQIDFLLEPSPNITIVTFIHSNWQDASPKFAEWSFNWALYLRSLKKFIETGTGRPYPNQFN
ncbi:SRPBCC domain-containing protein [Ohtaekwangia sp.]|uniref:SRPBCC domain-containing protein n=1 Tax=Ohtaekwangia sp. TaxID=2066019 RepID=UPI002F92344C